MSEHHHEPAGQTPFDPHSAASWDERYSGEAVWSGNPNQALVAEVTSLAPGRALDIGCGEGADAVWLAQQGWQVVALDISARAVERTLERAGAAGVEVSGVVAGFCTAELDGIFDLVSAMYPVLPKQDGRLDERLFDLVAPGGTLLFVHHAVLGDHQREHGFDPAEFVSVEEVSAALAGREGWSVEVDEQRERHVAAGRGAGHTSDHVVRARRS